MGPSTAQELRPNLQDLNPTAGFVIKARARSDQSKVFINVVAHEMVDMPLAANDKPVKESHLDEKGLESLRVPQFAGHAREDELARYIDVVFHPCVVKRATEGPLVKYFQQRLMLLSVPFVEQETGVLLDHRTVKPLQNVKYKSGGGVNRRTPWPIPVESGGVTDAPKQKMNATRVDSAYHDLMGMSAQPERIHVHQGKLQGVPKRSVVKKGFLNSSKLKKQGTGMYGENGSGEGILPEGAGDPMGWMPKKLRGMCNVVDTSKQSEADQHKAMADYATYGNKASAVKELPQRVTEEEFNQMSDEQKKLYLPEQQQDQLNSKKSPGAAALDAAAKISEGVDFNDPSMGDAIASFAEMMGEGAFGDPSNAGSLVDSLMGLQADADEAAEERKATRQQANPKPMAAVGGVKDEELDDISLTDEIEVPVHSIEVLEDCVVVRVEMDGVGSMGSVDLEVGDDFVEVLVPDMYSLNAELPVAIDVDTVKASFDKQQRVLTVRAQAVS
eukprot:TRINITY_DN6207_c0_g2_i2.p1 TRINITY_DN6207_c0_g2~~TRINITY_DN6207_c0_g2_i2.p1  ORF type:complete len:501 (+),score=167.25 TRINITY_DN6207_c0_g2_i2:147-1649(+)